jgi:hypothetical protein
MITGARIKRFRIVRDRRQELRESGLAHLPIASARSLALTRVSTLEFSVPI